MPLSAPGIRSAAASFGLSAALLGSAAAACFASPLEGTWRAVSTERDGAAAPDLADHVLTISGETFRITKGTAVLFGGTYRLPSRTHPQWINFRQSEGATLRGEWLGLYRVSGSQLEIVDNADDTTKPRPSSFRTAPGSGYVLVRFRRVR